MKSTDILCNAGKVCMNGKCIIKNPALENCVVDEEKITIIDAFGEEEYYTTNQCDSFDGVVSVHIINSCDGKKLKQETIQCQEGTKCTYDYNQGKNTCVAIDESKKSCKLSEDGQLIIITNEFGFVNYDQNEPSCDGDNGYSIPYCNGNEINFNNIQCEAGYKCEWVNGGDKCAPYDESKIKCESKKYYEDSGEETGGNYIEWTDGFGKVSIYTKYCGYGSAEGLLKIAYCNGNQVDYKYESCEAGYICNPKTNSCQKGDPSLNKCVGPTKEELEVKIKQKVVKTNEFGEVATVDTWLPTEDICVADVEPDGDPEHKKLAQFYCNGTEYELSIVDCPAGTKCKNGVCA